MASLQQKLLFIVVILSSFGAFCQNKTEPTSAKSFDVGLEGMIGFSFNDKTIGVNVGGPSFKLRCSKNFKIGVGALPSLIILDKKAYPRLGVSPLIEYKKWVFIAPYYGYDTSDKMIWTVGLAYRFY